MKQHERERCIERIARLPGKLRDLVAGLDEVLASYAQHGEDHLDQISGTLAAG